MDTHSTLLDRIRSALQTNNLAAARELSAQAIAAWPLDADALFLHGLTCLQCGDATAAVASLTNVVAVAPQLAVLQGALGAAHRSLGNLGEAERYYRAAIALAPESLPEQLGLIAVLVAGARLEEALLLTESVSQISGRHRIRALLANQLIRRSDPVLFDVGANEGSISKQLRSSFPQAVIHAFEPHPGVFAKLKANMENTPGITLNPCALGDTCRRQTFNLSSDGGSSSVLTFDPSSPYIRGLQQETENSVEVEQKTIDSYCREQGIEQIDFLKLDVQGFEPQVLDGAADMLSRQAIGTIQAEIIFRSFYDQPASFFEIERRLRPHGYRLISIFDIYPGQGGRLFQVDAVYTCRPETA